MNLLSYSYKIKTSQGDEIPVTVIDKEKIEIALSSLNKPKFISVSGNLLNTAFIVGIFKGNTGFADRKMELTEEEKKIHEKYLSMDMKHIKQLAN